MTKIPQISEYESSEKQFPKVLFYEGLLGKDTLFTQRHEAWIRCALATFNSKASAQAICWFWSETADEIIRQVFKKFCDPKNLAVFAMGKLGAQELNLSSDVDLLFVCKEMTGDSLKQVREFQNYLSQSVGLGFLFRCDLDLRPGGKSAPLVPSLEQVIDYYGNYGETWERIAFVRCRFIVGNMEIQSQMETFLKRFTYRRHLDFSLFEDLKGLREKIQKTVAAAEDRIHLKLAPGGIRDIELFINSLQVIHGGKNASLQMTNTDSAFSRIKSENILPATEVDFLRSLYWRLRYLENYLQALEDSQTHTISLVEKHPVEIAQALLNLQKDLQRSAQLVSGLLGGAPSHLVELVDKDLLEILEIPILSRQKERDQKTREVFISRFSEALGKTSGNRALAISFLKDFVQSVRAKSGLFTLLAREPRLSEDLAWLFGHSPYLSRILCQRPELLDSFVYRTQELERGEFDILLEQLLEKRLLTEIIEGTELLKNKNMDSALKNLTLVADEIAKELLAAAPSDGLQILALGKWGGQELGFRSDLDFIFIIDEEPKEVHFKSARRLISRLTEPHKGGSLYGIDMRLKPSGRGGPMIVQTSELIKYIENDSEPWERQVYLKARTFHGGEDKIRKSCYAKTLTTEDLVTLNQIRLQLIRPSDLDIKYAEGGMLDIELFVQTYLLKNQIEAAGPSTLQMLDCIPAAARIRKNYVELRLRQQTLHLISFEDSSDLNKKDAYIQTLAALFNLEEKTFLENLKKIISENRDILIELDPRRRSV